MLLRLLRSLLSCRNNPNHACRRVHIRRERAAGRRTTSTNSTVRSAVACTGFLRAGVSLPLLLWASARWNWKVQATGVVRLVCRDLPVNHQPQYE